MQKLMAAMMCHNVNKIRYPWMYAALSVLPVVDRLVMIDAGPHEDDTSAALVDFFINHDKVDYVIMDWPDTHEGLSELVNAALDDARSSGYDWFLQVQADEIYADWSLEEIENVVNLSIHAAASVKFVHYCGDFRHRFPFVYDRVVRLVRPRAGFRFVGDAVTAVGSGYTYDSNIEVHHVGKVHTGRQSAGAFKEYDFQSTLYKHLFNPDPKVVEARDAGEIDYFKVFSNALEKGEVSEYRGPWPKLVKAWAAELGENLNE